MPRPVASMLAVALATIAAVLVGGEGRPIAAQPPVDYPKGSEQPKARKVQKTEAEWAKLLTREQFLVTRRKATEPPFTGKYAAHHARGTYACVCCGADLFSSRTKFESGTGWPSFYQPVDRRQIEMESDLSMPGEARVEVMCRDCGAHLGHVFEDGPPPTGLRYCINSAALKFKPPGVSSTKAEAKEVDADEKSGASRSKGSAKAKARSKSRTRPAPTDAPPAEEPQSPASQRRPESPGGEPGVPR